MQQPAETNNGKVQVSICMITYNHARYILDAIQGIIDQHTGLEFELIISNDCSPDNTDEVVQQFIHEHPAAAERIRYFSHKKNLGVMNNFIFVLSQCSGTYIALCEGDDYWSNPEKLQRQFDFLESNPSVGLVHSDCDIKYEDTGELRRNGNAGLQLEGIGREQVIARLLEFRYKVRTATAMFRREIFDSFRAEFFNDIRDFRMADTPLWLELARRAEIGYMNEVTTVYRVVAGSASNKKSPREHLAFVVSMYEMRLHYIRKYNIRNSFLNFAVPARYYINKVKLEAITSKQKNIKYYFILLCEKFLNALEKIRNFVSR